MKTRTRHTSEQAYLLGQQYRTSSNLDARIELHRRFSTNAYGWHRWAFDQIEAPAGASVLEIGCGPGELWATNHERVPTGWRLWLCDLSRGMAVEARRRLGGDNRFSFAAGDAQSLPFEDGTFDIVVANHMLYHVPDRARACAEFGRVLKAWGSVVVATNGRMHMRELDDLLRSVLPPAEAEGLSELGFTLESGGLELREHFRDVELRRYDDGLVVTEVEPLVAYALSGPWGIGAGDRAQRLRELIEARIREHGAVRVTKDAGLFVCRV